MLESLGLGLLGIVLFIILFLALWVLIVKWIADRTNLPVAAVILVSLIPYHIGQGILLLLFVLAIFEYDVGSMLIDDTQSKNYPYA